MAELDSSISIDHLLGPFVICACITFVIFGIAVAQSYIYLLNCEKDPTWLKLLVASVTILETAHTAIVIHVLYRFTVTGFGKPDVIGLVSWGPPVGIYIEHVIVALAQGFFIHRLCEKSITLVAILSGLLFIRCGLAIGAGTLGFVYGTWESYQSAFATEVIVNTTDNFSLLVDALIAGYLIHCLRKARRGLVLTKEPTIVSVLVMITFTTVKDSFLFLGLNVIGIYANTPLGSLNARLMLKAQAFHVDPTSMIGHELSAIVKQNQAQPIEILRGVSEMTDATRSSFEIGRSKSATLDASVLR